MPPMPEKDHSTLTVAPVPRYTLIWVGVLIGVAFFLSDAFIDAMVFNEGTVLDQLLHPTAHELWMRLVVFVFSAGFGIYAYTVLRREQATSIRAHKAEKRLEVLFNSAAEFIFLIDADGTILRANQNVFTNSGYRSDEVIGRTIKEFLSPDSQRTCERNFPGLRETGYNRSEIEFVRKDGSIINMEGSATAVPNEQGAFTSFLVIHRDISERLRAASELEESERRFRAIFNSTYQFIGLLDPDGTVLEVNQSALDSFEAKSTDIVGKLFWETPWWTHSPQLQQRLKDGVMEAACGKLVRFEGEHFSQDGRSIFVDTSLKPVFNEQGEVVMIIPEGRDITERKHAEAEALRMQQESEHVMRISTMGEMASGMAHELNQPLAALVSCLTYEHRSPDEPPPPWFPSAALRHRFDQLAGIANRLRHDEERSRLPLTRLPDGGFVPLAFGWAGGEDLADVLDDEDLSGGDFVRNVRQLLDLLRQLAELAPDPRTAAAAREAGERLSRGVVSASSDIGV